MNILDQFIKFVNTKDENAVIINSFGWDMCAVGQFARTIDKTPFKVAYDIAYITGVSISCGWYDKNLIVKNNYTLADMLNAGNFSTYGQLQSYLKEVYNHG